MRVLRQNQRYLCREARRRERLLAESVKAVLAAAGDVQTATVNITAVLKHQLIPTILREQEVLQAFALQSFLASNGR
jgi:hypothetical protein